MKIDIDPDEPFEGGTLKQAIVSAAAQLLADHVLEEAGKDLDVLIAETREQTVRDRVAPLVEATICGPIQQTNRHGERLGPEITLKELVVNAALEALSRPVNQSYRHIGSHSIDSNDTRSLVHYLVARYIRSELEDQIKAIAANIVKVTQVGGRLSDDLENAITAALRETAARLEAEKKKN